MQRVTVQLKHIYCYYHSLSWLSLLCAFGSLFCRVQVSKEQQDDGIVR
jgi:hypothetical protein